MATADLQSLSDDALLQACINVLSERVCREDDFKAWSKNQQLGSRLFVECQRRGEGEIWERAIEEVKARRLAAQAMTRQDLDALLSRMKKCGDSEASN